MQQRRQADVEWQAVDASSLRHKFCGCQIDMATPYQLAGACQTPVWSIMRIPASGPGSVAQSARCPACLLRLRLLLLSLWPLTCLPLPS